MNDSITLPRKRADLALHLGWPEAPWNDDLWAWLDDLEVPAVFMLPNLPSGHPAVLCVLAPDVPLEELQAAAVQPPVIRYDHSSGLQDVAWMLRLASGHVLAVPLAEMLYRAREVGRSLENLPVWLMSREGVALRLAAIAPIPRLDELVSEAYEAHRLCDIVERSEADLCAIPFDVDADIRVHTANPTTQRTVVHRQQEGLTIELRQGSLQSMADRLQWGAASHDDLQDAVSRMNGPGLVVMPNKRPLLRRGGPLVFWLPGTSLAELLALAMASPGHCNYQSHDLLTSIPCLVIHGGQLELRVCLLTLMDCLDYDCGPQFRRDWVFASEHGCWHAVHRLTREAVIGEEMTVQAQCAGSGFNWNPYRIFSSEELAEAASRPPEPEPGVIQLGVWADRWRNR